MKILVTGANGYLGQGVVKALLDNGHSVVAADFKTNYVDTVVSAQTRKRRKPVWKSKWHISTLL